MSEKKDLTRIEDLSEYLHQADPETDAIFEETQRKIDEQDTGTVSTDTGTISAESLEEEEETEFKEFGKDNDEEEASDFGGGFEESSDFGSEPEETNDFGTETEETTDFGSDDSASDFGSDSTDSFGESSDDSGDFGGDFESNEESSDFSDGGFDNEESSFEESDDSFEMSSDESDNSFESTDEPEEASFDSLEESDFSSEESTESVEPVEESVAEEAVEEPAAPESPEPTATQVEQPTPQAEPKKEAKAAAAENFEDVRSFAQNISYTSISSGGNPPYSIMMKNIRFKEDAEEISTILEEFGIVNDNSRKDIEQGLQSGALLISQISEYSAIFLAHKLRRFDLQISVGLSDELHPSQSYGANSTGLVGKESLYQNHEEEINLEDAPSSFESILVATTPTLENYQIVKYIDVATEHSTIDEIDLREDDENLPQVYQVMAEKLKKRALSLQGNAIVGLNYQITPLPLRQYKVSCSGNIVWAQRRSEQVE